MIWSLSICMSSPLPAGHVSTRPPRGQREPPRSGSLGPMPDADIDFYFDPVCPFAWMTSTWVRLVMAQREYSVDWRFISLRLVNAHVDYAAQFPPDYEAGHTAGLRLLRVAARTRAEHGPEAVGRSGEHTS